jgi:hypothetical protein
MEPQNNGTRNLNYWNQADLDREFEHLAEKVRAIDGVFAKIMFSVIRVLSEK